MKFYIKSFLPIIFHLLQHHLLKRLWLIRTSFFFFKFVLNFLDLYLSIYIYNCLVNIYENNLLRIQQELY